MREYPVPDFEVSVTRKSIQSLPPDPVELVKSNKYSKHCEVIDGADIETTGVTGVKGEARKQV
jgi:hypothetical protein